MDFVAEFVISTLKVNEEQATRLRTFISRLMSNYEVDLTRWPKHPKNWSTSLSLVLIKFVEEAMALAKTRKLDLLAKWPNNDDGARVIFKSLFLRHHFPESFTSNMSRQLFGYLLKQVTAFSKLFGRWFGTNVGGAIGGSFFRDDVSQPVPAVKQSVEKFIAADLPFTFSVVSVDLGEPLDSIQLGHFGESNLKLADLLAEDRGYDPCDARSMA